MGIGGKKRLNWTDKHEKFCSLSTRCFLQDLTLAYLAYQRQDLEVPLFQYVTMSIYTVDLPNLAISELHWRKKKKAVTES